MLKNVTVAAGGKRMRGVVGGGLETERMGKPREVNSPRTRQKSGWCWGAGPGGPHDPGFCQPLF